MLMKFSCLHFFRRKISGSGSTIGNKWRGVFASMIETSYIEILSKQLNVTNIFNSILENYFEQTMHL